MLEIAKMKDSNTDIRQDIAVIKEKIDSMTKMLEKYVNKTEQNSQDITEVKTKLSNFNSFQTVLTFIGSAIATALAYVMSNKR